MRERHPLPPAELNRFAAILQSHGFPAHACHLHEERFEFDFGGKVALIVCTGALEFAYLRTTANWLDRLERELRLDVHPFLAIATESDDAPRTDAIEQSSVHPLKNNGHA